MVNLIDTAAPATTAEWRSTPVTTTRTTGGQPAGSPRRARGQICAEAVALLRMAQAGDRDAFAEIYRWNVQVVRRYVAVRLRDRDRDAVEDLVQDTFCAALDELDRAHDDVRGWLLQLAAKMVTRYGWSRRRYLRSALTVGEQQRILQSAVGAPAPAAAVWWLIAQALAELRPDERLTLQLRLLDAQPREAAARLMNCSVWTVSHRQRRALRRLADRLVTGPDTAAGADRPLPDPAA
jgi:RNA polymerase sigma-70 factor (ECF subfamily)